MITARIIQLGGTPIVDPRKLFKWSHRAYDAPADPRVRKLLDRNIKGEQCAITFHNGLLHEVGLKDPVTNNMVIQILQDEVQHEKGLQSLLEDLGAPIK